MDTKRLFLIRHGFSEGNADSENYGKKGDAPLGLDDIGIEQSYNCGRFFQAYFNKYASSNDSAPQLWGSTFERAIQTRDIIFHASEGLFLPENVRNEDALVEQNFGIMSQYCSEEEAKEALGVIAEFTDTSRLRERPTAKFPMGESQLDVLSRLRSVFGTLSRDYDRDGTTDNVLVTHGATMRIGVIGFLHFDLSEIQEKFPNPGNCDVLLIEGNAAAGYQLYQIYDGEKMRATGKVDLVEKYGLTREVRIAPLPSHIDFSRFGDPDLKALQILPPPKIN